MNRAAWLALLALGAALRMRGLGVHSLELDEATTLSIARASDPIGALLTDRHPPLSHLAFGIWIELFGQTEIALRLLPALVSTAALALFGRLAFRWLEAPSAWFAFALFAVAPTQVWYGQELRMVPFVVLGTIVTLLGVDAMLRPSREGPRGGALVALGTFLCFGGHYLGLLVVPTVVALGVAAAASGVVSWLRVAAIVFASAAGLLPWIPWIAISIDTQYAIWFDAGGQDVDVAYVAALPIRMVLVWTSHVDTTLRPIVGVAAGVLSAGLLLQGLRWLQRGKVYEGWPLLAAAVPLLVALGLALRLPPELQARDLIVAAPGATLAMAAGLGVMRPWWLRASLAIFLVGVCAMVSWNHGSQNLREDWRAAAADVAAAFQPGDRIVVVTGTRETHAQAPLRYYLRGREDLLAAIVDGAPFVGDGALPTLDPPLTRVHLVVRDAPYSTPLREQIEAKFEPLRRGPVRHRIQHILLRVKSS